MGLCLSPAQKIVQLLKSCDYHFNIIQLFLSHCIVNTYPSSIFSQPFPQTVSIHDEHLLLRPPIGVAALCLLDFCEHYVACLLRKASAWTF